MSTGEQTLSNTIASMSVEDKLALCVGADFWRTRSYPQYGIPSTMVADGPHGVRYQADDTDMLGIHASVPATCFPTAAATGCSFDKELVREVGAAIGEEARALGVGTVLGPGLNIKRNPLCGRNFEYYSEDPFLTGQLGAAFIRGVQQNGVGACPKHFAANSQEYRRFCSDDHIDDRTLREIYLAAFETAVKDAKPAMLMSAYNKINGAYCSSNKWLLTDVLRGEWGFSGMVVTDWGGTHDRVSAFKAGCDLSMPGNTGHLQRRALEAYRAGELPEADISACAERVARRAIEAAKIEQASCDMDAHHALAKRAATESAVLLKNDGFLPLHTGSVALIGHMAKHPRFQGTGSSHINPTRLVSLCDAAPSWQWTQGCREDGGTDDALIDEAVAAARKADVAVVVAGLPDTYEAEGFDRENMRMPEGQLRLIEAVSAANRNTVVVLLCGSPIETPWFDKVGALLYMALPGQAGGEAVYDLLTGKANPCGKLAETWPLCCEDAPSAAYYGKPHRDAQYREGVYVGYRYYETSDAPVRFHFGYGMSYTTFEYSDLKIDGMNVSCTVTNTGKVSGAEVIQLYIAPPKGGIHRPAKELRGFEKIILQSGESRTVSFDLNDRAFVLWDDGWRVQQGRYEIQLASSVRDVRLTVAINVEGENIAAPAWQSGSWYEKPSGQPPKSDYEAMLGRNVTEPVPTKKGAFTDENTISEMAEHSLIIKLVMYAMTKRLAKQNGGTSTPAFRMALASSVDAALFSVVINACGELPENVSLGLLDIANGHLLHGLCKVIRKGTHSKHTA